MQHTCLIVARGVTAGAAFQRELALHGFKPCPVESMRRALGLMQQWQFDAVLLDADDFGERHVEMLRSLRHDTRAPLLVLTGDPGEASEIAALEAGATDLVRTPVSARLVATKLRRLLEIGSDPADAPSEVMLGPLTMHARRGTASIAHLPLRLTHHQFDLLYLLASRPGEFVHREAIARALHSTALALGRSADVHIYRIRRKLRELGVGGLRLDTVHGRGYCLSIDPDAAGNDSAWHDAEHHA